MSYYTRSKAGLIRHWARQGRQVETAVPTKTISCDACGWTTQAIDNARAVLERCICGGTLRVTTAIKDATR